MELVLYALEAREDAGLKRAARIRFTASGDGGTSLNSFEVTGWSGPTVNDGGFLKSQPHHKKEAMQPIGVKCK